MNQADHASTGLLGSNSKHLDLWFNGPHFLWKSEFQWPKQTAVDISIKINQDKNKSKCFGDGSWGIKEVRDIDFKLDTISESCSMDCKDEEDCADSDKKGNIKYRW